MTRIAWVNMSGDEAAGYGKVGKYLAHFIEQAGAEMVPFRQFDWDVRVAVGGPRAWLVGPHERAEDLVWHTMFEARPLPPDWVPVLNRCRALWVPTQWNVGVFREAGVTVPIHVSGYGVSDIEFHPLESEPDPERPYVFLWCGTSLGDGLGIGDRKGGDLVLKAFRQLDLPDTRLVLKVGQGSAVQHISGDERVRLIARTLLAHEYGALLATADCFVYPSRGEGFGLQPLEAMAVGLPVIAPAYSGLADFIADDVAIPLPVRGEETAHLYEHIYGHKCSWAKLTVDDVAERMLWCYQHQDAARAIGERAASRAASWWTWEQAGQRGLATLERILQET